MYLSLLNRNTHLMAYQNHLSGPRMIMRNFRSQKVKKNMRSFVPKLMKTC